MNCASLMEKFKNASVLVVGDICLDRWCHYDPKEADPSRETGIARVGVVNSCVTPGAGGTAANNLASLGAGRVAVLGAIGQDGFGFELERSLGERRIEYRLLVASARIQTFTYTKLTNLETDEEDLPRIDFINSIPLPSEVEDQLIANFHACYNEFDVVLVADQAETDQGGVITDAFREVIADVAERKAEMPIIVDSRHRIEQFRNTVAKPNLDEADSACLRLFGDIDYQRLRSAIGDRPMVITKGSRGSMIVGDGKERNIPAAPVGEPVDICGAGDSFAAGMALALYAAGDFEQAVRFGNLVAGITIMKKGTGVALPAEVLTRANSIWN